MQDINLMWNFLLLNLLIPLGVMHADEFSLAEPAARSLFYYTHEQALSSQARYRADIVVMRDGTLISGTLDVLPSLKYSFGYIPIGREEVALIANDPDDSTRWEVLTTDGQWFRAPLSEDSIPFIAHLTGNNGIVTKKTVDLNTRDVSFVLLTPTAPSRSGSPFQLMLKNQDELPIHLTGEGIAVSDGHSNKTLDISNLLTLSFNGGLHGTIKNSKGEREEFGIVFAKDPYVTVRVSDRIESLSIPWTNVDTITAVGEKREPYIKPILTNAGEIPIPEVEFITEAKRFLAFSGEIDIPEITFLAPAPMLLTAQILESIPEVDFQNPSKEDLILVPTIAFEALAVGKEFTLGEEEEIEEPEEMEESQDVIFISQGQGERQPFLETTVSNNATEKPLVYASDTLLRKGSVPLPVIENEASAAKKSGKEDPGVMDPYEGMVKIAAPDSGKPLFCIQRKKVTNREYKAFVQAIKYQPPTHWVHGNIPPGQEDDPVVNVSYKDALLYAVWSGKRLPSYKELEIASSQEGVLADKGDGLKEWTSTPYVENEDSRQPYSAPKVNTRENISIGHAVFGNAEPTPMENKAYNTQTGFRLACVS